MRHSLGELELSVASETRQALFFGGLILIVIYASCVSHDSSGETKTRLDALDSRLSSQAEVVDYMNSRLFELERSTKERHSNE